MTGIRLFVRPAGAIATVALLVACATNPVTGKRELALVSESQEIQMGQQGAEEVSRGIGLVDNQALQSYVRSIGMAMAAQSERPNLPWDFKVLDDASVNAFALPGGFIFVTRGILTHMASEAELASVLGHEIGHVTARHSVQQISQAQLAQIGLGVGSILSPTVAQWGDVAAAGLGLLFLKFGRDDELQADQLGFRYALTNGYDVRQMISVFEMLERQSSLAGGGRLPEWQSTHPDPGARIRATQERVAAVQEDLNEKRVGESEYFARIDGLIYGMNPRLGFFEGTVFYHPDLQFRFEFPSGWKTQNQAQAVVGVSPAQDAITTIQFAQGSAQQAAQTFFSQQGMQSSNVNRGSVNGFPAVRGQFVAQTEQGALRGMATFVEFGGATYRLLSYTPAERFNSYAGAFERAHTSFNRVTDSRVLSVQPMRLKIERAPGTMTLAQFNQQLPSVVSLEELAVINGVSTTQQIRAGELVKRVIR